MKKRVIALFIVFALSFQMFAQVSAISKDVFLNDEIIYSYYEDGKVEAAYIGENLYSNYEYADNDLISSINFANGQSIEYDYDNSDRITNVYYDDVKAINYEYSNYGEVGVEYDYNSDRVTSTIDNELYTIKKMTTDEEMFRISELEDNKFLYNIDSDIILRNTVTDTFSNTKLVYETENNKCTIDNNYDCFGRIVRRSVKNDTISIVSEFKYIDDSSDCIKSQEIHILGRTTDCKHIWEYEYDSRGNITNRIFKKDGRIVENSGFKYDKKDELSVVSNNQTSKEFIYDDYGNTINVIEYEDEKVSNVNTYEYSDELWDDKLTRYNNIQVIYDAVGNPVSYNNNKYQWAAGRRLKSLITDENENISYYYDELGHRTKKIVKNEESTIIYEYFWTGDVLLAMTVEGLSDDIIDTIYFLYDFDGNVYGFIKNGVDMYLYETSTLGNVIAIYDDNGIVASYDYDDLGNIIYSFEKDDMIKYYNPFYYRSYFYDVESELYYLLSRYYVPEWGRFLNADAYFSTGVGYFDTNMFAYCDNNYVNFSDPYGYWKKEDHRDWSKDLAYEGGFNNTLSNAIGEGSYSVDIDMSTNPLRAPNEWRYNQRFHFDRRNYCDNISNGEDTRIYYANIYIDDALERKENGDTLNAAILIGQAIHFLQDISAHGNVDINSSTASHGIGFDNPKYEWKNNNRISVYKVDSDYQYEGGPKGYSSRYSEVMVTTAIVIALYKNS